MKEYNRPNIDITDIELQDILLASVNQENAVDVAEGVDDLGIRI